jgi:hypothetical protein
MTAKSRLIALERKAAPPKDTQIYVHMGSPYDGCPERWNGPNGEVCTEAEYNAAALKFDVIYVKAPLPNP